MFKNIFEKYGIKFHFTPMGDAKKVSSLVNDNTKLVWVETPTNPMMNIIDIEEMAKVARSANAWLCVDNTFATPYLQSPLDLANDHFY